jgi:anti-sigma B factor antagonist
MDERPQFCADLLWPCTDLALIVAQGELDLYTAPQLAETIGESIARGARRLVIDLSEVPFIDSTGLCVLVQGLRHMQPRGGSLDIVCSRANILRTFEIAALRGLFALYANRGAAMADRHRVATCRGGWG